MSTSWRDYPGNEAAFGRLKDLLRDGEATAFIGAGASAGLYPLWGQLLERLIGEAEKFGRVTDPATIPAWRRRAATNPDSVARSIKEALTSGPYYAALREIFRPKADPDGKRYTPTHERLLRLPFKGYITTNYDSGLIEARADRRDCAATGYHTWADADAVQRWQGGEIFKEHPCPILFAHGVYERDDSIVLGTAEYRRVYQPGAFRRLFDSLWSREHLVFIGFSFADPWIKMAAQEVLTVTGARTLAPRHIAVIGLPQDEDYAPYLRDEIADQLDAEPLFYPVFKTTDGGQDHSQLAALLTELTDAFPAFPSLKDPVAPPPVPPLPPAPPAIPQAWTHKTTEDDKFTGREEPLRRLDRWARDEQVRLIAVTGVGGLGKTSLIGRWLKRGDGLTTRAFAGLFYWSFYAERDSGAFINALLRFGFGLEKRIWSPAAEDERPVKAALDRLKNHPLLLVLDGLEVLQELPGDARYGALIDNDLRELLDKLCIGKTEGGLTVMTSRFPFPDFTPRLGTGFRNLDLDLMTPAEGADLLAALKVDEEPSTLQEIAHRVEGHPMGLRLYALVAAASPCMPDRFSLADLPANEALSDKLRRLLKFYEAALPADSKALLGLVSFFRAPAPTATLLTLARGLLAVSTVFAGQDDGRIAATLRRMANEHLLIRDNDPNGGDTWSCHPILHDHFRTVLLGTDKELAQQSADLIVGPPSAEQPTDITQLRPVLDAIDLLLEAGAFNAAHWLYNNRLGDDRVFFNLAAIVEGLRCAEGFVGTTPRRAACRTTLGLSRFSFYLNAAGLFAGKCGDLTTAAKHLANSNNVKKDIHDIKNLAVGLRNQGEIQIHRGMLRRAKETVRIALAFSEAQEKTPGDSTVRSLCGLGHVLHQSGDISHGLTAFMASNTVYLYLNPDNDKLVSIRGVRWASLFLRIGYTDRAAALTVANLKICREEHWLQDIARCRCMLGRIAAARGIWREAEEHITEAENTFRRGGMIADLLDALIARAELELRRQCWDDGLAAAEEALRLAGPRGFRLVHADALTLRAKLLLGQNGPAAPARAGDDAEDALRIAQDCEYAWAERDAWEVLAQTRRLTGDDRGAEKAEREAAALNRRLSDTTPPYPDPFAWVYDRLGLPQPR
jgi:hypothetical protein